MHTTDSTTESPRLRSVKELLEQLGSMRTKGLGARERLDFLMSRGPELVKDFSCEDAFDVEARTRGARLQELEDLSRDMDCLERTWRGAPLLEDVRQAGRQLFKHLSGFVREAVADERRTEIDMLSAMWRSAPDIRAQYPWLTGWTGKPEPVPSDPAARDVELKTDVEETIPKTAPGQTPELEQPELELEQPELETRFPGVRHDESPLSAEDLRRRDLPVELDEGTSSEPVVIRDARARAFSVTRDLEAPSGSSPEELARLRQDAWTDALRSVSLEAWDLRFETEGHLGEWGMGRAIVWKHGHEPHSSARLEWAPAGDQVNVRLLVQSDELGTRDRRLRMDGARFDELCIDPSSFVADVLAS